MTGIQDDLSLTARILQERFPNRIVLTAKEVAEVIHGKMDAATVQRVHRELERGILIPGLRKEGGRWRIPVQALIRSIDGLTHSPEPVGPYDFSKSIHFSNPISSSMRRRKSTVGYRPGVYGLQKKMEKGRIVMEEVFGHIQNLEEQRKERLKQEQEQFLKENLTPHVPELKKERF